jgi:hypothetical protein
VLKLGQLGYLNVISNQAIHILRVSVLPLVSHGLCNPQQGCILIIEEDSPEHVNFSPVRFLPNGLDFAIRVLCLSIRHEEHHIEGLCCARDGGGTGRPPVCLS